MENEKVLAALFACPYHRGHLDDLGAGAKDNRDHGDIRILLIHS
jgi:hypothetical protein